MSVESEPSAVVSVESVESMGLEAVGGASTRLQYDLSVARASFDGCWDAPMSATPSSKDLSRIAALLCRLRLGKQDCCKHRCLKKFRVADTRKRVLEWRKQWHTLSRQQQNQMILDKWNSQLRGVRGHVNGIQGDGRQVATSVLPRCSKLTGRFLGHSVCTRAWTMLVGCSPKRLVAVRRSCAAGHLVATKYDVSKRKRHIMNAMHGAVMVLCKRLHERMPFKNHNQNNIDLPLARKRQLFNMLKSWYNESVESLGQDRSISSGRQPLLPKKPKYRTFLKVFQEPEFANVRFHRVVDIGRCSKCAFYNWKLLVVGAENREIWERLAAKHQWLQLSQKKQYAVDRAEAANTFPSRDGELYIGIDGGSGFEVHLPHFSAFALEGPNKALQKHHTLPFKVMNGLVHGDTRSHVLLSPGSIVAAFTGCMRLPHVPPSHEACSNLIP